MRAPLAVSLLPLLACGLNLVGAASGPQPGPPGDPANPGLDGGGPQVDGGPIVDGAPDGGGCVLPLDEPSPAGGRTATAIASTRPKSIAGGASQFDKCVSLVVRPETAALGRGVVGAAAKLTIEWEPTALWILADVIDLTPGQGTSSKLWENDGIELYVSGTKTPTERYGPADRHYTIDHRGAAREYSGGQDKPFINAKVEAIPNGYRVVVKIDAADIGGTLSAERTISVNLLLNDGVGQNNFVVWAMQPNEGCLVCSSKFCPCGFPSEDPRLFAPLSLR